MNNKEIIQDLAKDCGFIVVRDIGKVDGYEAFAASLREYGSRPSNKAEFQKLKKLVKVKFDGKIVVILNRNTGEVDFNTDLYITLVNNVL